jgi:energy-coupling factor transporter ATP-binding protein EcfA2
VMTIWFVAVVLFGGGMWLFITVGERRRHGQSIAHPSPGWVARRRARNGVTHPAGGAAIGYRSAFGRVSLTAREFALGGLALGAPGSGKTTLAMLLVQALERNETAGVILDPKPSRQLAEAVAAVDGIIWTLGGALAWDALPDDPTELANQLLEIEPVDGQMRVYRNAARLQALAIGQYLQRCHEHPTLARVADLMRPGALTKHPEAPKFSQTEWEGVRSFGTSLQILSRGAAGRSLDLTVTSRQVLRLEDAIADGKVVLFQLDSSRLPEESRQVGAWVLRAMLRLLRQPRPCWLIADEFVRLGWQGRHALELLAMGREFGKPVVLLSQGPSDFRELGPHALDQVAQDAAWIIAFRQGTRDSETAARLLGVRPTEERSWTNDGRETVRIVEREIVPASVLEDLQPGSAWVRVPPIERRRVRVEPVRVALPKQFQVDTAERLSPGDTYGTASAGDTGTQNETALASLSHRSTDEEPPDPRIERYSDIVGVHWVWRQGAPSSNGYPRLKMRDGKYAYVHILWWEHINGPRPKGDDGELLTVDHTCEFGTRCVWPGCKRLLGRGPNTEARWARERSE